MHDALSHPFNLVDGVFSGLRAGQDLVYVLGKGASRTAPDPSAAARSLRRCDGALTRGCYQGSELHAHPGSILDAESHLGKGTGRPVGVEEDALWRAPRCNQRETTWRDAIFEQPLSFAEHQRKEPDMIFVDEFGGDQRLQQFTAAPDMQRRPIRRLQSADFIHEITAYVLRVLPVETIETMRDDVFRRLVERLPDRVVALVRPVGGEDLVGPTSQKHVELTGDSLVNGLAQGVVHEGHGPASVGEPVPWILLGATGRLHNAVQRDLGNGDELSHCFSPLFFASYPNDERPARLRTQPNEYFYQPELLPGRRYRT